MKALEKNGYKKEGVFKKALIKNDKVLDEHKYFKLNEF
jgi:RimJ/RimL family protein N-acetyltransferase